LPDYFLTDYATVPDLAHSIIKPRDESYDEAAMWHDYLVRYRRILGISLPFAHRAFDAIMKHRNAVRWKRKTMVNIVYAVNWMVAGDGKGRISYKMSDQVITNYTKAVFDNPIA